MHKNLHYLQIAVTLDNARKNKLARSQVYRVGEGIVIKSESISVGVENWCQKGSS